MRHQTRPTTPPPTELPATGFIRQNKLVPGILPVSPATLRRMVQNGEFPQPLQITERVKVWDVEAVRNWLNSRKEAANHA